MKCIEEKIGQLITFYEFGQLAGEQKKQFEAHLVKCNYCFQRLVDLAPTVNRIRENPARFLPALKQSGGISLFDKISLVVKEFLNLTLAGFNQFPAWGKIALPVAVAALFIILNLPKSASISDLAIIEPVPYIALKTRGAAGSADRLFDEGMLFYVEKKYDRAIEKLVRAVEVEPDNASFQFYLGLNYLLNGNTNAAINHFEKVIAQGNGPLFEKTCWYLGNAFLTKGNSEQATQEFEKVVELDGDFAWDARQILNSLKRWSK